MGPFACTVRKGSGLKLIGSSGCQMLGCPMSDVRCSCYMTRYDMGHWTSQHLTTGSVRFGFYFGQEGECRRKKVPAAQAKSASDWISLKNRRFLPRAAR